MKSDESPFRSRTWELRPRGVYLRQGCSLELWGEARMAALICKAFVNELPETRTFVH
jgi:hypothetical protein